MWVNVFDARRGRGGWGLVCVCAELCVTVGEVETKALAQETFFGGRGRWREPCGRERVAAGWWWVVVAVVVVVVAGVCFLACCF